MAIDLVVIGSGQIVDRDGGRAAKCVQLDVLYALEVNGDAGDVPRAPHAAAVGRYVDFFVDVRTVEQQRIVAALALDSVAAIARIPDEGVVASAELGNVVAATAVDEVVVLAALDDVIAVAAVERELDLAGYDRRS